MGGGGGAAADLLEAQKEIIVATWKLQRRAIAGQSAADVRAIAKAQGELQVRPRRWPRSRGVPRRGVAGLNPRRRRRLRRRRHCRAPLAPWPGPRRRSAPSSRTTRCRTRCPPTTSC